MSSSFSRREFMLRGAGAALAALGGPALLRASAPAVAMLVYKDPGCGCCEKWVMLMKGAGFALSVQNTSDMASIKTRYKVTEALASCHTALVGGYVIEGHVPADLIRKVLAEKPKVAGLAVPGMVTGSPGMEGSPKQAYDVVSFDVTGRSSVYARR